MRIITLLTFYLPFAVELAFSLQPATKHFCTLSDEKRINWIGKETALLELSVPYGASII